MKTDKTLNEWEERFLSYLHDHEKQHDDAAHDIGHFKRVYNTALLIAEEENSPDPFILLAAAYFHDIVSLSKDHPENHKSSYYAAIKTQSILTDLDFPQEKIDGVCHAIETHSFSANIEPKTLEAKIIQDADRMEALGAIGIMRTFYVSGKMKREPFDKSDPLAKNRELNDKLFGLDHFYQKLFKLPALLKTKGGKQIALQRTDFLHTFIDELIKNITSKKGEAIDIALGFYNAGLNKSKLFNSSDPLATNRSTETEKYALDHFLTHNIPSDSFLNTFLTQLKIETKKT